MVTQAKAKLVAIVDDDELMRSALQGLLKSAGLPAQAFASAEEFLKSGIAGFPPSSSPPTATRRCGCKR